MCVCVFDNEDFMIFDTLLLECDVSGMYLYPWQKHLSTFMCWWLMITLYIRIVSTINRSETFIVFICQQDSSENNASPNHQSLTVYIGCIGSLYELIALIQSFSLRVECLEMTSVS